MDWRAPWEGKHWVQGDGEAKLTEELSIYTARAALGDIVKIGETQSLPSLLSATNQKMGANM